MAFSILGCPHNHLSFPMVTREAGTGSMPTREAGAGSMPTREAGTGRMPTREAGGARPADANPPAQAHVTCLDCGREFWYDWARMRRLAARPQAVYVPRRAA